MPPSTFTVYSELASQPMRVFICLGQSLGCMTYTVIIGYIDFFSQHSLYYQVTKSQFELKQKGHFLERYGGISKNLRPEMGLGPGAL